MDFDITQDQRALLLRKAARHEALAEALRELASLGRPSDERIAAAPVVHGWRWDSALCATVRGSWHDGRTGHIDADIGGAVANMPGMSAILTVGGWYRLGIPDDVRAKVAGAIQ